MDENGHDGHDGRPAVYLYKGKKVELLEMTYFWKGAQYCTILMENRYGQRQRQSVRFSQLKEVDDEIHVAG